MSSARLASVVKSDKLRENDRVWVPRWLNAYRRFCDAGRNNAVPVHRELLVAFLRQEKARAWQRLQIARAVEHYRDAILGTAAPVLKTRMILIKGPPFKRRAKRAKAKADMLICGLVFAVGLRAWSSMCRA